jgi:hypothetical protein
MMVSAVTLSGVTSREPGLGVLVCPVAGARGRVTSVGISAALFDLSGFRRGLGRADLRLSGQQVPVPAQHPYRFAAPGTMKRLEDARKESLAPDARPGLAFAGRSTHRWCPACWCASRRQNVSVREKGL